MKWSLQCVKWQGDMSRVIVIFQKKTLSFVTLIQKYGNRDRNDTKVLQAVIVWLPVTIADVVGYCLSFLARPVKTPLRVNQFSKFCVTKEKTKKNFPINEQVKLVAIVKKEDFLVLFSVPHKYCKT